jgi:hypothetical protein
MKTALHILLAVALVGGLVNLAFAIGALRSVMAEEADIAARREKARQRAEALRERIRAKTEKEIGAKGFKHGLD